MAILMYIFGEICSIFLKISQFCHIFPIFWSILCPINSKWPNIVWCMLGHWYSNLNTWFGRFLGLQYELIAKIYFQNYAKKCPFFVFLQTRRNFSGNFRKMGHGLKCQETCVATNRHSLIRAASGRKTVFSQMWQKKLRKFDLQF